MTQDELKALYAAGYKVIRDERRMREYVFRNNPTKLAAKLEEIDQLRMIFDRMKDELKARLADESKQPTLLDVPRKAEYN